MSVLEGGLGGVLGVDGVGCPCPPVRNDIVTPRHLLASLFVHVCGGSGAWMGVGCPCPPVRNDIVTPRHLLICALHKFEVNDLFPPDSQIMMVETILDAKDHL